MGCRPLELVNPSYLFFILEKCLFKKNWWASHSIQFTLMNLFSKINIYWFFTIFVKFVKHLDYVVTFPLLLSLTSVLNFAFKKEWKRFIWSVTVMIHTLNAYDLWPSRLNVPRGKFSVILLFSELKAILYKYWLSFFSNVTFFNIYIGTWEVSGHYIQNIQISYLIFD